MPTARTIITLALEGMNRLSPGETLDADVGAVCLRRLNVVADDWSAGRDMMPQDVIVSGAVTGASLMLGAGLFAALGLGPDILAVQADGYPVTQITMQQYLDIPTKTTSGRPEVWIWDGLSTVFLYPASAGSTINIAARKPFGQFVDLDTNYVMPAGFTGAFAASLAVAMAPALLGDTPPSLLAAKRVAIYNVSNSTVRPAMLSASPLACRPFGSILQGWR